MDDQKVRQFMVEAWNLAEGPATTDTYFGKATDMREILIDEMSDIFSQFAKLIVRECADSIIDQMKRYSPEDVRWKAAMRESASIVGDTFGIDLEF